MIVNKYILVKEGKKLENKSSRSGKNKSNKKKRRRKVIIIASIFILLAAISATIGGYSFYELSKIKTSDLSKNKEDLGIDNEAEQQISKEDPGNDITNIALFGLDRREKDAASRSDAIMIASIDKKHKKIKLSSIMRDTYVKVDGHGMTKMTHAYAYGGPQLAIKTLNENFNLNIKDYVAVDFFSLEKIIDSLGGVTIDVNQNEIKLINSYMGEVANIEKSSIKHVTKSGSQTLNGMQAVAYSRIRYVGNGDYERTERQRKVLTAMLEKIQNAGVTKYPSIVTTLLPYTETSLSKGNILSTGVGVLTSGTKTIDQERFPTDGNAVGKMIGGVSYITTNLSKTTDQIHKYIYDDIKPNSK